MKNILFLTLLLSQFCLVSAQKFENKMDSLISSEFKETESPGLVFLVAKNGKPIYEKAIGKANLELNVDMATNQVFQIASMTKQFTAVAVLMLEEQGKLSVNDAVSKYIPDYPNGNNITLHHLLNHTSGIKDFTKIKALKDISQKEMTPKMMVDFFKNEKVDLRNEAINEKIDFYFERTSFLNNIEILENNSLIIETEHGNCTYLITEKGEKYLKQITENLDYEAEKERIEFEKSKTDLVLAQKMLKEFPKTKMFSRISLFIAIVLALKELYILIKPIL